MQWTGPDANDLSTPDTVSKPPQAVHARHLWTAFRRGPLLALILVVLVASLVSPEFATWKNLSNVLRQASPLGIVAIGQTFVVLTGGIDLSVASVVATVSVVAANMMQGRNETVFLISGLCLAIAALVGLINGLGVSKQKIPPFIMTLGVMLVVQGARFVYSGGAPKGSIPTLLRTWGLGFFGPVPVAVLSFAVLAAVAGFVLKRTTFGRYIYAVGGNPRTARLSGVPVDAVLIAAYVISGVLAGLGGLLLSGYIGVADNWLGKGFDLDSIAAVVIGGTLLAGGQGGVSGTVVGVLLIVLLFNLVLLLALPVELQLIIKGAVIIAAVALYARGTLSD